LCAGVILEYGVPFWRTGGGCFDGGFGGHRGALLFCEDGYAAESRLRMQW
jgi:hypothetical protein